MDPICPVELGWDLHWLMAMMRNSRRDMMSVKYSRTPRKLYGPVPRLYLSMFTGVEA